jgi:hypothetical protein
MVESCTMTGFMGKIDVCLGAIMVESHTMIGFMRKIDVCLGAMIHGFRVTLFNGILEKD